MSGQFPPEWRFECRIDTPEGIVVEVTTTMPASHAGPSVTELVDHAQMAAARLARAAQSLARKGVS